MSIDGEERLVTLWGWSHTSLVEATAVARDRLNRLRHSGQLRADEYYPRVPLREEVLHEVRSPSGELLGVVTRNRYGADVLNTDAVVFVDIDAHDHDPSLWDRLRKRPAVTPLADAARASIQDFASRHPDWGVSAYRTAAGFRVLVTGTGAGPNDHMSAAIMDELSADRIYAGLCAAHDSFRARLTPKPWRVGWHSLNMTYPDSQDSPKLQPWLTGYRQRSQGYATCQLLMRQGPPASADEQLVIDLHDQVTLANSGLSLA